MHFANPEAFALLLLLPLALVRSLRRRQHGAACFSSLSLAAALPNGLAIWGSSFLIVLRLVGLGLLIVALARPQTSKDHVTSHSDGIAIQMVTDNSYSMRNRDYDLGSQAISRLDAVKHAMRLFVAGGDHDLRGRPNDKIGVITFARDPEVLCPATLDHEAVLEAINRISLAPPIGTNIGDALAWALQRLRNDPTKQKVIILLSDGSHNVKEGLPPLEGAQLAADLKIRVYTIGAVGNHFDRQQRLLDMVRPIQLEPRYLGDAVDEPMMQQIAEQTGGRYFRATDTHGLLNIYQEIDRLETTQIQKTVHVSYREWFLMALSPALGLLLIEQLLRATRLLRIP